MRVFVLVDVEVGCDVYSFVAHCFRSGLPGTISLLCVCVCVSVYKCIPKGCRKGCSWL